MNIHERMPEMLTGINLWEKYPFTPVGGGLADGDPISTWTDSSGNGHNATQTGSARPIFKTGILGGKPVVRFSTAGTSGLNLATSISGAPPFEMFVVGKSTGAGVNLYSLASSTAYPSPHGFVQLPTPAMAVISTTGLGYIGSNPYTGVFHIFNSAIDASTSGLTVDGAATGFPWGAGAGTGSFNNLGYRSADSTYSDGDIAEIIIYNVILSIGTGGDRAEVTQYLLNKYGITPGGGWVATTPKQPDAVSGLVAWWKADSLL